MAASTRDDDDRIRRTGDTGSQADGVSSSTAAPAGASASDQSWLLPMLRQAQEMVWTATLEVADTQADPAVIPAGHTSPVGPSSPVVDDAALRPAGDRRTPDEAEGDGTSQTNPHGFLPPPPDAMVTMALVDWSNIETGETWTAPSGGYQPPSEAWVIATSGGLAPEQSDLTETLPAPDDDAGEELIQIGEPWSPWTSVVDTLTLTDEAGSVVGYEVVTHSSDVYGNWTRSTQSYTADWRALASSYSDNSGFGYTFKTLWSEDGLILGYTHHFTGAGNAYAIEVNYDADWRIQSSFYEDPTSGYRAWSEFWYDDAGAMVGGTTRQSWTDENGPQSLSEDWWVNEPIASEEESPGVDESAEVPVEPFPGEPGTGDDSEEAAVPEIPQPAPGPEEESGEEVQPEIIICPGIVEIPPGAEGSEEAGVEWPTGGVDPVPEPILIICPFICPWEPAPDSIHDVVWEEVQWNTGTPEPEAADPEICVLPPPPSEPPEFDSSWLRPAVIDFEPVTLVGVLPDGSFG